MKLRLAALCLLVCGVLGPALAAAAVPVASLRPGDVADAQKRPRRIALLPVKSVLGKVSDLFAPERSPEHLSLVAGVEASVADALRGHGFVQLLDPAGVRARLSDDHSARTAGRLAAERYRLGLEYYLGLAPARAVESLRRAVALYQEIFQEIVATKPIADAAFMLGVSLVDAGNAVAAHVALKDAFALQPERRFRPRFFGPQVEAALSSALADHLSTGNHSRPYGEHERMLALARRLNVDAIVTVAVVRDEQGALEVRLAAWRRERQGFEAEARFPLAALEGQLEPFVSRWLACVPVAQTGGAVQNRRRQRPVWMDTSASYALYLRQPTRLSFHSLGFAAGVAVELRPNFEWFARVNMYTSLSDPYRDLLHAFNSVRAVAGVGFAIERGPLRFVLQPGLDLHVLGSFIATTDPNCKLFGERHPLCNNATVSNLEADVLVGLNIATVGIWELGRRFLLIGRASVSTYFLPLDGTDRLNFPISAELGLGYRF
ncbi:MAG: hypothetical protein RIT45_2894 [Pseudomonadota bacterium]|jgi:hypothetical protein